MSENSKSIDEINEELRESSRENNGLICLYCLLLKSRFEEIQNFIKFHNIDIPDKEELSKLDYLKHINVHFYTLYNQNEDIKVKFKTVNHYIGEMIASDEKLGHYLTRFDFFAKQDLIEAFSDFCADLGISVYDSRKISSGVKSDLYLIRRTPFLRTETVFLKIGENLDEKEYKELFYLLNEASSVATWTVFVTTPYGAYKIGLERLIADMKKLNVWLYIVNPLHKKILGLTKGGKNKDYESSLRDSYIEKLPKEPIRAPSKVVKISNYDFNEGDSYDPDDFFLFESIPEKDFSEEELFPSEEPKYREIFRDFMVIDQNNGLPLISYSSEKEKLDKVLVSGFLSAMDSFIEEIGGSNNLNEISYKGFYVQAAYGSFIKTALFLTDPADKSLKERLSYFIKSFETIYKNEIEEFEKTGDTAIFPEKQINRMIREILDI